MKNKIVAFLLVATLSIGLVSVAGSDLNVYAATDKKTSEESEKDAEEAPLTEAEINQQIQDGTFITGSQQNFLDNEIDVDIDIEEAIDELIPEEKIDIKISTEDDLVELAKNCRLDTWSANKNVILMNDITLNNYSFKTIPYFAGTFEGNNHTITGYYITDNQSGMGFFSEISKSGIVKNLKLKGRIAPTGSTSIIGALCARNYGAIVNCSFDGSVSASDYVGGLVGINKLGGIIADCDCQGYITGEHFTGGICGENMGTILRSTNGARVNTEERDVSLSLEEINLEKTINLLGFADDTDEKESDSMRKGIVDTGGIAGLSIGVIQKCVNNGYVGYEKIGYNVGGIAGRQSGYMVDCVNNGKIYGRKDVGGITGQAEPYVTIDFTQDTVRQLSDNISKLHDIISVTLSDADGQSDAVSNRLAVIQQFTSSALNDTAFLADNTVTFVDGVMDSANQAISRVDYILDEAGKDGGVFDTTNRAIDYFEMATGDIEHVVNDLDIYEYMTLDEQMYLSDLKDRMEQMSADAKNFEEDSYKYYENYYIDKARATDPAFQAGGTYDGKEVDLRPIIDGSPKDPWTYTPLVRYQEIKEKYQPVTGWKHLDGCEFKNVSASCSSGHTNDADKALEEAAAKNAEDAAKSEAETLFKEKYGSNFITTAQTTGTKVADILLTAVEDMYDTTDENAQRTADDVKKMAEELKSVNNQTKDIINHVNSMPDINLPKLGDEYKAHATNLNNNLQGMCDNFGYLNSEMNNASDVLIGDLSAVNDQFNVIMMLYTDAIDGVLDKDYSNVIEDDSTLVAETCVDATIDSCVNNGPVEGSLNVSGIVGTMAIEYDYDLESDVTGIKDSNMNTTYLTKCVLREDVNRSTVKAQKSYVGGVCGLQELGTVIKCENYGKVDSESGDYVGGIAGDSLSDIIKSYSKCLLKGGKFVGGIVGLGSDVSECLAIPTIIEADNTFGAIAGDVASDGVVRNNFFVNDNLAGIDRVSYSKKAEPVTYEDILAIEGVPADFSKMKITFVVDDEDADDILILEERNVPYASSIEKSDYPTTPSKAGFYTVWDTEEVNSVNKDIEIIATYERLLTTLASDTILSNNQSAVLVDGLFRKGSVFNAVKSIMSNNRLSNCIEYWDVEIPEDGLLTHQVRYLVGDQYRDEIGDDFEIYTLQNGIWAKASTGKKGAYTTFDVSGNKTSFQVINVHKPVNVKFLIFIAIVVVLIFTIIIILIVKQKRKKKAAILREELVKSNSQTS